MMRLAAIALILLFSSLPAAGEDSIPPPPVNTAGAQVEDSTAVSDSITSPQLGTLEDSILYVYPDVLLDTLNEKQRTLLEFETRYRLRRDEQDRAKIKEIIAPFSYFDTLAGWLVSPRWSLRDDIDRGFYHDAGDYFRFDPSFVITDHQVTPMRKTVQPYGLKGNRLGIIADGKQLTPFEHIIEPDGMIDLNDVPTALDNQVVLLPGPMGMMFGASHSVATLLTRPSQPLSTSPQSTFLVDKGSFGYSYARGRYSKLFTGGKEIDMSIGYRNADGAILGRGDDAYHQWADAFFPFSQTFAVQTSGWLYDRKGRFLVRPNVAGASVDRDRIDRQGRLGLVLHNPDHSVRNQLTYTHIRQTSGITGSYMARQEHTGHALELSREWMSGHSVFRAEVDGDYLKYDDWWEVKKRYTGGASLGMALRSGSYRLGANLRGRYVEDFDFQPSASIYLSRESNLVLLYVTAGYSQRAPSLYELNLRYQGASIYGSGFNDYADRGNPDLDPEKIMSGALGVEIGSLTTNLALSVVGGRIVDGIDWLNETDSTGTTFSPANNDIDFATATANARLAISSVFAFRGGGSYHFVDYIDYNNDAYTPEYQAFGGAELHIYWYQKLIHFYAYGEVAYVGPYDGYIEAGLGEDVVVNGKLSFRMGDFRFHWVVQNMLTSDYSAREYFRSTGRYNYYGFTWDFLN